MTELLSKHKTIKKSCDQSASPHLRGFWEVFVCTGQVFSASEDIINIKDARPQEESSQ